MWKKIVSGFLLSVGLEACQFIFCLGASDITDVISNTTGLILGLGLYSILERIGKEKAIQIVNRVGLAVEIIAVFLIVFLRLVNR